MSKSNKYKIYYCNYSSISRYVWKISCKKLNLILAYKNPSKFGNHACRNNFNINHNSKILNNFIIEPSLLTMLKNTDKLSQNLAFEILNNRLNDRTK